MATVDPLAGGLRHLTIIPPSSRLVVYWARAEYEKGKARASPFSPHGFANHRSHQGWWLKRNHHGTVKPDHSCGETREGLGRCPTQTPRRNLLDSDMPRAEPFT